MMGLGALGLFIVVVCGVTIGMLIATAVIELLDPFDGDE